MRRLESPDVQPLCGEWKGRWKAFSIPVNDRGPIPKSTFLRFYGEGRVASPEGEGRGYLSPLVVTMERLRERSSELFRDSDSLGIIRHLLVNETVPGSLVGLLRELGFVHLVTASGIHLYAVSLVLAEAFYWVSVGFALRAGFARSLSRVFSFAIWFLIWLLSGMRLGMLRPWLVVSAREASVALGFKWRSWAPLFLALLVDLGATLFLGNSPGRLHYALAVGGGLSAMEMARGHAGNEAQVWRASSFKNHLLLALGSSVPLALVGTWETGLISLATPILSVLTLPIFSIGVFPGALLAIGLMGTGQMAWAQKVSSGVGEMATQVTEFLAGLAIRTHALWVVPRWAVLVGALMGAVIFLVRSDKRTYLISFLLLGTVCIRGVLSSSENPVRTDVTPIAGRVEQLDVGQGDAALVWIRDGEAGLIDAGSEKALTLESWLHLFSERGIRKLSFIALTHLDEDHSGGARRIAALMPVSCIVTSEAELSSLRGARYRRELQESGVRVTDWNSRCFPFPVLPPADEQVRLSLKTRNDHMSSMLVPLRSGWTYLSMGDAGGEQEDRASVWASGLLERHPARLILKLSHHGSRYSSSEEVLLRLRPEVAWVSSGVGNTYGHPSPLTLMRIDKLKIPVWRTDERGVLSSDFALPPRAREGAFPHQQSTRHP